MLRSAFAFRRRRTFAPWIGPTALMIACAGERLAPAPNDPMRSEAENNCWETPGLCSGGATGRDDPASVRLLLDRGAWVNAKGQDGWTALMSAASTGHSRTALLLLQQGAGVDAGWKGVSPLMEAVYSDNSKTPGGFCATAQVLLDAGADVNGVCDGETPLYAAAQRGDITLIRLLLDRGADVNALPVHGGLMDTALAEAAQAGDVIMTRLLLSRGADVNAGPQASLTPLAAAAMWHRKAMLRFLVSQGADVNAPSADGNTALLWASDKDEVGSVILLLAHRANVNVVNRAGHTALYFAGSGPVVRLLLRSGVSRAMKNIALEQAALRADAPSVRLLLSRGADPNARDWQGRTVLIDALDCGDNVHEETLLAVLRPLLAHGADADLADPEGVAPLTQSAQDAPTVRLLLAYHADVNARAPDGHTALMQAVVDGSLGSVRALVSHGADVNARNKSGGTALMFAVEAYLLENNKAEAAAIIRIIRLLLAHGADPEARDNQGDAARALAAASPLMKAIFTATEKKSRRVH